MSPEPGQHVMPLMGLEDMFTQQCRDFLPTCRPWNSSRHGPKLHPCGQLIFPTANGEGAWTGRPGAPLLGAGFPGIRAPLGPLAEAAFAPCALASLAGLQAAFGSVRHGGQSASLDACRFTQEAEPFSLTWCRVGTQE